MIALTAIARIAIIALRIPAHARHARAPRNSMGSPRIFIGSPRTCWRSMRLRASPCQMAVCWLPTAPLALPLEGPVGPQGSPIKPRLLIKIHRISQELGNSLATKGFRVRAIEHLHQDDWGKHREVLGNPIWILLGLYYEVIGPPRTSQDLLVNIYSEILLSWNPRKHLKSLAIIVCNEWNKL